MAKKMTKKQRREKIGVIATSVRAQTAPPTQHHRNHVRRAKSDVVGRNVKHKGGRDE